MKKANSKKAEKANNKKAKGKTTSKFVSSPVDSKVGSFTGKVQMLLNTLRLLRKAGKKGIDLDSVEKLVASNKKVTSTNLRNMIKKTLGDCVARGVVELKDEKYYYISDQKQKPKKGKTDEKEKNQNGETR